MAARKADVPAWVYVAGAVAILCVLLFAPGVLNWGSELISNRMVDGVNDMQPATTTTVP